MPLFERPFSPIICEFNFKNTLSFHIKKIMCGVVVSNHIFSDKVVSSNLEPPFLEPTIFGQIWDATWQRVICPRGSQRYIHVTATSPSSPYHINNLFSQLVQFTIRIVYVVSSDAATWHYCADFSCFPKTSKLNNFLTRCPFFEPFAPLERS